MTISLASRLQQIGVQIARQTPDRLLQQLADKDVDSNERAGLQAAISSWDGRVNLRTVAFQPFGVVTHQTPRVSGGGTTDHAALHARLEFEKEIQQLRDFLAQSVDVESCARIFTDYVDLFVQGGFSNLHARFTELETMLVDMVATLAKRDMPETECLRFRGLFRGYVMRCEAAKGIRSDQMSMASSMRARSAEGLWDAILKVAV